MEGVGNATSSDNSLFTLEFQASVNSYISCKATLFLSTALFNFGNKQFDDILFDADNGFLKNFTDNFYLLIRK